MLFLFAWIFVSASSQDFTNLTWKIELSLIAANSMNFFLFFPGWSPYKGFRFPAREVENLKLKKGVYTHSHSQSTNFFLFLFLKFKENTFFFVLEAAFIASQNKINRGNCGREEKIRERSIVSIFLLFSSFLIIIFLPGIDQQNFELIIFLLSLLLFARWELFQTFFHSVLERTNKKKKAEHTHTKRTRQAIRTQHSILEDDHKQVNKTVFSFFLNHFSKSNFYSAQ